VLRLNFTAKSAEGKARGDVDESIMEIKDVRASDAGVYHCRARNEFGADAATVHLAVRGDDFSFFSDRSHEQSINNTYS
jgi:hypothetical protein